MIVCVGGQKGGSGKSTLAVNLAVLRAIHGYNVLLCDADDQETATDFTAIRAQTDLTKYASIKLTGQAVRTELLKLKEKYQDIVIDTGGRDTTSQRAALSVANILLVPFVPRSFDIWTLEKTAKIVEDMRQVNQSLEAYSFLNRADPKGRDNEDAAEFLRDNATIRFMPFPLGTRKAFSNASAAGLSVVEYKPFDLKAYEEITKIYNYVFDIERIPF